MGATTIGTDFGAVLLEDRADHAHCGDGAFDAHLPIRSCAENADPLHLAHLEVPASLLHVEAPLRGPSVNIGLT